MNRLDTSDYPCIRCFNMRSTRARDLEQRRRGSVYFGVFVWSSIPLAKIRGLYFHSTSCISDYIVQFHIRLYFQPAKLRIRHNHTHFALDFSFSTTYISHFDLPNFSGCSRLDSATAICQHATFRIRLHSTSNRNSGEDNT